MGEKLATAAHKEGVLPAAQRFRSSGERPGLRSKPDVRDDGSHAIEGNVGAGHADQSALLVVDGLGNADQVLIRAADVEKRLAQVGLSRALGPVIPLVL